MYRFMIISPRTQHYSYISPYIRHTSGIKDIFCWFQNSRLFRGVLISWIAVMVVVYVVATYFVFGLGMILQQQSRVIKDLTESSIITELNFQQRQTEFVKSNKDILQSMQRISDMRYVLPTDTTISRVDIFHQGSQ